MVPDLFHKRPRLTQPKPTQHIRGYLNDNDGKRSPSFNYIDPGPVNPEKANATYPSELQVAREALKSMFGLEAFRGDQEKIISRLYHGGSAMAVMPTASGKSLIYLSLARHLLEDGLILVIEPYLSLLRVRISFPHISNINKAC